MEGVVAEKLFVAQQLSIDTCQRDHLFTSNLSSPAHTGAALHRCATCPAANPTVTLTAGSVVGIS